MSLLILVGSFFVFVALGIPIAFSMGASSLLYILLENPAFLVMAPSRIYFGANNFVLIALPLFMLAGELMNHSGVTERIVNFCKYLVRPFKGGLGEVNVLASMIFGGISGSSVADTSAIGAILIPQMVKEGYSKAFAVGVTVASSTMGMIIPPSIPMLLFAMLSERSVGALFLAGTIPGVLIGVTQIGLVYYLSKKKKFHPVYGKMDYADLWKTSKDGFLAIIMPIVVVLSIVLGVATATEAGGIAVAYTMLLGFLIYRRLKAAAVISSLKNALLTSSSIMLIVGFAAVFVWLLAVEQVPYMVADFLTGLGLHRLWMLMLFIFFILLTGTFIDVTPNLILFTPILLPVMDAIGVDRLQFGALTIAGLAVSLTTPPVGMCLNVCSKISGLKINEIFIDTLPFLACNVLVLLLIALVPAVSLWLPGLFY